MDFTAAERATFTLVDRDPVITEASGRSGRAAFGEAKFLAVASKTPLSDCDRTQSPRGRDCRRSGYLAHSAEFKELRGVEIQHLGSYRFAEVVIGLPPLAVQFLNWGGGRQEVERSLRFPGWARTTMVNPAKSCLGRCANPPTQRPKHGALSPCHQCI